MVVKIQKMFFCPLKKVITSRQDLIMPKCTLAGQIKKQEYFQNAADGDDGVYH